MGKFRNRIDHHIWTRIRALEVTRLELACSHKYTSHACFDCSTNIGDDVIANDDNLVRVWRFSNPDQSWSFYDPRPAFADANTLAKTGAGDIVWVNVTAEQTFQSGTLFPGWNLISLK